MKHLENLRQEQLFEWAKQAQERAIRGQVPDYIPLLQQNDCGKFVIYILTVNNHSLFLGNLTLVFPVMSVIKPFLLLYLLEYLGQTTVFQRVGNRGSDYPFNSLEQLQADEGFPRNPMINSGAITLASLLPGNDALSCCESLRLWLNNYANCQLFLDELMLESVLSLPNLRNQTLLQELTTKGYIKNPQLALNTYNHICCLSGTIVDLVHLGLLLVKSPNSVQVEHCKIVRDLMTTCGLYENSAKFAQKVGLPTKSGVSGAVLSIVPEQGAIACYSPPLDPQGNSVAGLYLVEQIAKALKT